MELVCCTSQLWLSLRRWHEKNAIATKAAGLVFCSFGPDTNLWELDLVQDALLELAAEAGYSFLSRQSFGLQIRTNAAPVTFSERTVSCSILASFSDSFFESFSDSFFELLVSFSSITFQEETGV